AEWHLSGNLWQKSQSFGYRTQRPGWTGDPARHQQRGLGAALRLSLPAGKNDPRLGGKPRVGREPAGGKQKGGSARRFASKTRQRGKCSAPVSLSKGKSPSPAGRPAPPPTRTSMHGGCHAPL